MLMSRYDMNYFKFTTNETLERVQSFVTSMNNMRSEMQEFVNEQMVLIKEKEGLLDNNNLIEIDEEKIALFERQKREMIFLDPEKYGPINRNLSNIDNLAPTKISSIDNRWMMRPYGSGEISGGSIISATSLWPG
jgi:hypothetical protein